MKSKTVSRLIDFSVVAFLVFIICMMLFWGCKHEPSVLPATADAAGAGQGSGDTTVYNESACDPDSTYFENEILPLFISNCAKSGCHDATTHEKDFVFNSFDHIMASGEIIPGNPSAGDIMEVITETDPDKKMPPAPNTPLTTDQIRLISNWISQGALNNSCSGQCDTIAVTYSGTVAPLLQAKCAGCHNNTTLSGNINLSNYAGTQVPALNGRLLAAVNHQPGYSPMPKGGNKIPQCEIDELTIWIEDGAPDN
jgi:hypothetical protein